jgi:BASS family bile acid:Na+ symporter
MNWDYAFFEYYLSATLLVFAMVGMGTTLTPRDFWGVVRAPQGILLVLALQVLITPLLAMGLANSLALPQGVAVGMLLVAALPGGSFSNVFAYIGRGNVALSISATAVSTLGCLLTTSLVLTLFGGAHLPADFKMPVRRILGEITCCLLIPLLLGMLIRRLLPEYRQRVAKICIQTSLVMLLLVIVGALCSGRIQLAAFGWKTPVALFLFGVFSVWLSYGLGFVCRLPLADSYTIAIEVVVRNAHLGLLLKAALFPAVAGVIDPVADGVLFVVLFYGGTSLFLASCEVFARRMKVGAIYGRSSTADAELQPIEKAPVETNG